MAKTDADNPGEGTPVSSHPVASSVNSDPSQDNQPTVPEEWVEWQKYGHSLIRESGEKQDTIAKYVITLVSTIIGTYTTLLTFFWSFRAN